MCSTLYSILLYEVQKKKNENENEKICFTSSQQQLWAVITTRTSSVTCVRRLQVRKQLPLVSYVGLYHNCVQYGVSVRSNFVHTNLQLLYYCNCEYIQCTSRYTHAHNACSRCLINIVVRLLSLRNVFVNETIIIIDYFECSYTLRVPTQPRVLFLPHNR